MKSWLKPRNEPSAWCGEPWRCGVVAARGNEWGDGMTSEHIAFALSVKGLVEDLRDTLTTADDAINPKDLSGISLHEWNTRLKSATWEIQNAIAKCNNFLKPPENP